jgi:hypothetical protein
MVSLEAKAQSENIKSKHNHRISTDNLNDVNITLVSTTQESNNNNNNNNNNNEENSIESNSIQNFQSWFNSLKYPQFFFTIMIMSSQRNIYKHIICFKI